MGWNLDISMGLWVDAELAVLLPETARAMAADSGGGFSACSLPRKWLLACVGSLD